jgi:putative heme-binding domain-containing protein
MNFPHPPGSRRYGLPFLLVTVLALGLSAQVLAQNDADLNLPKGTRISIVGNTLADRMQHDGWLETYLYSRFPKNDLVFRNLGFSGDELTVKLRSANFGSPDDWLSRTETDVVFAFFGYNESFAGQEGLDKFKRDLDSFVKHTLKQKYNGTSKARLVLFSPIAQEDLNDPNFPDGKANNQRLEMYTQAIAEVAKTHNVPFVDLFHPAQGLYIQTREPLTINGVHLNELGNKLIARVIDRALFPKSAEPTQDRDHLEKIRQAVLNTNFHWYHRYRTVDGYSIYGGRAGLKFTNGQTNFEVMQREMQILDEMAANRDKVIWAAAQGKEAKVDDSDLSPFIPVISNKQGPLPGGKHLFLDGEEAIKKMKVAKGMKVTLFASEKEFPELVNPVQMAFDTKGRLWVAAWRTYPHWKPGEPMDDKLLIFEDTNGDGKADKMKVFADDLHSPTGFEFWNGGVLVGEAPYIVFLKDTDGDDKYDVKTRMLAGIDSADTHHTANSFTFDPGGALYFQEGTFHHTQVETPWGPPERCINAGVFRYEPRTGKFDTYVGFGFANPHGHVFDRWGQDVVIDGTGAVPYHGTLFSGQLEYPQRHAKPPTVYQQKTRPCSALEILSSSHFPKDMQGNLLVPNVIGFLGILQYKLKDDGASFTATEVEPLLQSSDANFRPADLEIGPDGALYFTDWHNPIIGHMQHNLRDPNRDQTYGRIYKLVYEDNPLLENAKIYGAPINDLLDLLKSPENRVRYRAKIELSERDTREVINAVQQWIKKLDPKDAEFEHHMMEGLWLYQYHNVVNEPLLKRMLASPDFHARAAATRVLCYWRDRVNEPLELLRKQINDAHPRVRLEAIRALSFFHEEKALAVAVELLTHPDDKYLRFVFNETLNTLERRLGSGQLNRQNIAASLLNMLNKGNVDAKARGVLIQTITRHGSETELTAIWDKVRKDSTYPNELRRDIVSWLTEAALTRKAQPKFDGADVRGFLKDASTDEKLWTNTIRLATAWKVKEAEADLDAIAAAGTKPGPRLAAIDSLVAFGSKKTLNTLAGPGQPMDIRFRAASALAQIDLEAGAKAAAQALATSKASDDPGPVVEAFLVLKNGPKQLAAALEKQTVSKDSAKRILRAMYMAGQSDPSLSEVVSKLAGLDAAPKAPTNEELAKITAAVMAKGDAARGELVFRRMDLGCFKCHAINKAGGDIGPDLGPIAADSPLEYIARSILDPNQAVKEEYLTKVLLTDDGKIYQGVVVERNKNLVKLKDATGKIIDVPAAGIVEELPGKSLMPTGVTQILTEGELLDLIRFVSELGRKGSLYHAPATPTIRGWKVLRDGPDSLQEGIPNREIVRDVLLSPDPKQWESVFSLVNGTLPLAELRKADGPKVVYLQGEIQVVQGGPIEVNLKSTAPAMFWVDEEGYEKQASAVVELAPGRHRITVRVEIGAGKEPALTVELRKPEKAQTSFEVVQAN